MSGSFAVSWLSQQSRDTNLKESTTQVPIDASLCSLRPSHGGKEVLRIDSDHIQASGFDCLRQHNQRHELDTLHRLSALGRRPMQASFPFCILPQASSAPSHTSQSRPFVRTFCLIHQRSRCQASTSSLQTQKGFWSRRFPRLSKLQHQATHPETCCGGVLFLFLRSPLFCHIENDASGIARAFPHTAEHGLFSLGFRSRPS